MMISKYNLFEYPLNTGVRVRPYKTAELTYKSNNFETKGQNLVGKTRGNDAKVKGRTQYGPARFFSFLLVFLI